MIIQNMIIVIISSLPVLYDGFQNNFISSIHHNHIFIAIKKREKYIVFMVVYVYCKNKTPVFNDVLLPWNNVDYTCSIY